MCRSTLISFKVKVYIEREYNVCIISNRRKSKDVLHLVNFFKLNNILN